MSSVIVCFQVWRWQTLEELQIQRALILNFIKQDFLHFNSDFQ